MQYEYETVLLSRHELLVITIALRENAKGFLKVDMNEAFMTNNALKRKMRKLYREAGGTAI